MAEPWHITLFGGLRAQRADLIITRFKYQKVGGLLAYLAYHQRQMHSREILVDIFWPESNPETARNSLSAALSSLRNQFEPPGTPSGTVLRADRYSVGLNHAIITTDVAEFEAAVQDAEKTDNPTQRMQSLERALRLYQGRLLPGFYEEWIGPEQERLAGVFFDAVTSLIADLEEQGDLSAALRYARQAVSVDPWREETHQHLMHLLAASGQHGAALRQFKEMERRLEEELGAEPSASLRALARQIEKQSGLTVPSLPAHSVPPHPIASPFASPPGQPTTLTFLLTDIEDSTRQWERTGDAYKTALAMHHMTLRGQFADQGGQEIKEAGDAFLVAFQSVRKAVVCAVACQRALAEQAWPEETGPLKVRMAIHTGDVEFDDNDYRGLALHLASRMLTAAHGGHILVSNATAELIRNDLSQEIHLVDLGVYRLRDVATPERLHQVDYPGLTSGDSPPLSAEAGYLSHLPLQVTRFFGREQEIARLRELLLPLPQPTVRDGERDNAPHSSPSHLITLSGPGGTGKTRLALEVAERLSDSYHGAVWFVGLGDFSDPSLIAGAILDVLRIPRSPQHEPLEQVVQSLSHQPSLLVLDNYEHLVEEGAGLVQTLLSRIPSLTVLVTSRQLLGLTGERDFAVSPLPTPNGGETAEQLSLFDSVALFVDRAQAAMPHFQVTSHNAPAVAELCQRLEGIPLALELAAARALVMTPTQMLAQLEQRFDFLVSRKRDATERHRTLQAAVDWSYRLLSPELQRFFGRLSVFRGGWTAEAAEDVCEDPLALDHLALLRECSLVLTDDTGPEMRFRMLETLREYAEEQLAVEERIVLKRQHLAYFLRNVEQADAIYSANLWVFTLDPHNYRAALRWARSDGDAKAGLRMAGMLGHTWWWEGFLKEAVEHLTDLLSREDTQDATTDRARALYWKAWITARLDDPAHACTLYRESLAIYRQINHKRGTARALCALGDTIKHCGKHEDAKSFLEESLVLFREIDDPVGTGAALRDLGDLALRQGDYAAARDFYDESAIATGGICTIAALRLAEIALLEGDYEAASREGALQVEVYRQNYSPQRLGEALLVLGGAAMHQSDLVLPSAYYAESMLLFKKIGSVPFIAKALRRFAYIAVLQVHMERAARLFGADESLCEAMGIPLPPCEHSDYERNIALARENLGNQALTAAWETGRAMTWEQAVAYALEEDPS